MSHCKTMLTTCLQECWIILPHMHCAFTEKLSNNPFTNFLRAFMEFPFTNLLRNFYEVFTRDLRSFRLRRFAKVLRSFYEIFTSILRRFLNIHHTCRQSNLNPKIVIKFKRFGAGAGLIPRRHLMRSGAMLSAPDNFNS